MYVCICNAVTDGEIREAVHGGANTLDALGEQLGVGTCCGRCASCARKVIHEAWSEALMHAEAAA